MWHNIIKMLGVELEEEFTIKPFYSFVNNSFRNYKFKFIEHPNRLCYKTLDENEWHVDGHLGEEVVCLLVAEYYDIVKI